MDLTSVDKFGRVKHFTTRHLMLMSLILALRYIISLIPGIEIGNYIQMGFGFVGQAFAGAILGPFYGVVFAILYDLLDIFIFHPGFMFFPGFTLSAALGGFIYAKFLWHKEFTWKRITIMIFIITIVINIVLNSLWLNIMYGKAWSVLLPPRLIKNAISLPLNIIVLYYFLNLPTVKRIIHKYQF